MPEGDYLEKSATDAVVDEVVDARKVQPSNYIGTRRFDLRANAGFFNEQRHGSLDILAHSSRSGEPIPGPPLCGSSNFARCARLDADVERQG
ncbi:MAG: hypothetical protein ACI841_004734 [Planctomycetota bacterium]|jgi:hypothetical protein